MTSIITTGDVASYTSGLSEADVRVLVDGANAKASRVAPCLSDPSADQLAEARLVLIGAVRRWAEAGAGAFQQQTAGPYSVSTDTRQRTGYSLWPSEISALQDICASADSGDDKAFSIDTAGRSRGNHMPWCALMFGANYCSCGSDLNRYEYPLYEGGALTSGEYL